MKNVSITTCGDIRIETENRVSVIAARQFCAEDFAEMDRINNNGERCKPNGKCLPSDGEIIWVANTTDAGAVWATGLGLIDQYVTR